MILYFLFLLFSLGSLGRLSFIGQEINVYLYEFAYALFLGYLVVKYRFSPLQKEKNIFNYIYVFLLLAVATFLFSLFSFTTSQNTVAALYLLRLALYLLGIPYVLHHVQQRKKHKESLKPMLLYAAFTAAFAIVQYLYYPNLRNLEYLGWDPHQFRVFGSVFDTSTAAALYGMILLFLMFVGKKIIKSPVVWLGSIIFFVVVGALTYSRGFYLSITITLLYYLLIANKRLVSALYVLLVAVALIALIPKPQGESANLMRLFTIQSRATDYQTAAALWQKNPILGIGYNHIRYVKPGALEDDYNHAGASLSSSFLIILVTTGIVGLAAYLLMLYKLSQTSQIAFYSIMFLSVFSLSDNIFLHPFVLFLETFFIAWGITSRTSR